MSDDNVLYRCAELSSQAFVSFDLCDRWGDPLLPLYRVTLQAPFGRACPRVVTPSFIMVSPTQEDKHELELSPSLFSLHSLSPGLPAHSSVPNRPSFPPCPKQAADVRRARVKRAELIIRIDTLFPLWL